MKHKSVLIVQHDSGSSPHILLLHIIDPASSENFGLIAELKQDYLWGGDEYFPYGAGLCMFAESGMMLFCSQPDLAKASAILASELADPVFFASSADWQGAQHHGPVATLLEARVRFSVLDGTSSATAVLCHKSCRKFTRIFIAVIILTILLVALLSASQIRRTMVPLEKLIMGTNMEVVSV